MERSAKQLFFSSLVLLLFSGCRKEAAEVYPDMAGIWEYDMRINSPYNSGIRLTISSGSSEWYEYPQYSSNTGENGSIYTGKAWIKNNQFNLKRIQVDITENPHYDTAGNYVMKLGSRNFYAALVPQNVHAIPQQTDSVIFYWDAITENAGFNNLRIEYKKVSETVWTAVNTNYDYETSNSTNYFYPQRALSGFSPATVYEWRMKTINGIHESGYTAIQTFTTP